MNVRSWAQRAQNNQMGTTATTLTTGTTTTTTTRNLFGSSTMSSSSSSSSSLSLLPQTHNIPLLQSNALSAVIQSQLFGKTQEDVLCTIMAVMDTTTSKVKTTQATSPFLLSVSATRTKAGYKDPKLHEIKTKNNGELMLKSSRSLKSIERFIAPNGFKEMIGYIGNDTKKSMWCITNTQTLTHSLQNTFCTNSLVRDEFLWWCCTVANILQKTDLQNNLDPATHTGIFQRFAKIITATPEIWQQGQGGGGGQGGQQGQGNSQLGLLQDLSQQQSTFSTNINPLSSLSPSSFTPLQRYLVNALIDKKRLQAENQNANNLRGNLEQSTFGSHDLLVLPDMTAEEAATLTFFVEQGQMTISKIGDLEQYLQQRLLELQTSTISNIFESQLSHNAELLSLLLDSVLDHVEEIHSWTQTYDATLVIMAQGIKKIESQGEILDVEDSNYANLTIVLLWLLTEITLPTRTYNVLQDRKFRPQDIDNFVRACLQLDSLLTSTRLTVDNAGLLPQKPTVAKERAKRRIHFPLFNFKKDKDQLEEQKVIESLPQDDLDVILVGKSSQNDGNDNERGKSNTATGQLERGKLKRPGPGSITSTSTGGGGGGGGNNNGILINQGPTMVQTAGGGTSSVAAALQAAGINLNTSRGNLENTDLVIVMQQKTEKFRQGEIDFTAFSGLSSVIHMKKQFKILSSSTANGINTCLYGVLDRLVLKYTNYPISDTDLYKVKNGSINEIMLTKMGYKLSVEKYKKLHAELSQYKTLVGICERLSPGYLIKFREEYCKRIAPLYKADIASFFEKIQRVIHGSSVDCRLRSSPSVGLNELQAMANIYRDAVLKGKKADKATTQAMLGMKAKLFHTEQISSISPAPPGKMYASDVYKYSIERCLAIIEQEQEFLLNMFIIWEETDIKMMYRSMIENPLIEMGKKYLLYPDKSNSEWLKSPHNNPVREQEVLSLFRNVPLQVPSTERSELNQRSLPPQGITSQQSRHLQSAMSMLLQPLIPGLLDIVAMGDKLDHFSVIHMLVHSERTITQATPRSMWKETQNQKRAQQKNLLELEKQRLQQQMAQNQQFGGEQNAQFGDIYDLELFDHKSVNKSQAGSQQQQQLQQQPGQPPGGGPRLAVGAKDLKNLNNLGLTLFNDSDDDDEDSDDDYTDSDDEDDSDYSDSDDYSDEDEDDSDEDSTERRRRRRKEKQMKKKNLRKKGPPGAPISLEQTESTRRRLNNIVTNALGGGHHRDDDRDGLTKDKIEKQALLNSYTIDDYFYSETRIKNNIGIEFLITVLTQVISSLKIKWNQFIDKEVLWIESTKVNAKQEGVLEPFLRFPSFIERLEAVCYPTHSLEADHAYVKISVALLKWLLKMAKLNPKYENTVIYENTHHFCQSIGSRRPQLTCLESNLYFARYLFLTSRQAYVRWNIEYEMPVFVSFCSKLFNECKLHLPTQTLPQIPLLSGLSKDVLRKLFRDNLSQKALLAHTTNILKRLQRQLPYNQLLVRETYLFIREHALALCTQFLRAVELCYLHEHVPLSLENIHLAFNQVLSLETIATSVQNAYRYTGQGDDGDSGGRRGVEGTLLAGHGMLVTQQLDVIAEKAPVIKKEQPVKRVEIKPQKPEPPAIIKGVIPTQQQQQQQQQPKPIPKRSTTLELPPELSSDSSTEESSTEEEEEDEVEEFEEEDSEEIFEFVMDESDLQDLNVDTANREIYAETVSRKMTKETQHKEWETGSNSQWSTKGSASSAGSSSSSSAVKRK